MSDFQNVDNFSKSCMRTWFSLFSHWYSTILTAARLWGWSKTGFRSPTGQISLITPSRRTLEPTSPSAQSAMRNFPSGVKRLRRKTKKLLHQMHGVIPPLPIRLNRIVFNWLDNCSYLSTRTFWSKMITSHLKLSKFPALFSARFSQYTIISFYSINQFVFVLGSPLFL
jgi:hypothetical protein